MAIESPKYKIITKDGSIELREYSKYLTASVEIIADSYNSAGNNAFGILADYIFGNNIPKNKISMTAPVMSEKIEMTVPVSTTKKDNNKYVISFSMPSKYNLDNLPKPVRNEIGINEVKKHKAIVIKFSGYTREAKIAMKIKQLRNWSKLNNINISGNPVISRYDPPWKPGFLRRNEISYKII